MISQHPKCVVGLIGGIGSGKSQVAAEFARHGAKIINADQLGHEALEEPNIREQIFRNWGSEIGSGENIDRRKLGAIVFAQPKERKRLEDLVFPYIEQRIQEEIDSADEELIILDAAILLETGWGKRCSCVVYVHASYQTRLQRLTEKRGWNEKEVLQRSKAQMSLTDKVSQADFVVNNDGTLEELAKEVSRLLENPEFVGKVNSARTKMQSENGITPVH